MSEMPMEHIEQLLPPAESRESRIEGKHYVHLFGADWPLHAKDGEEMRAFRDTLWLKQSDELGEQIIMTLIWINTETISVKLVHKLVKPHVTYYLEFDDENDAIQAKLTYLSFF